MRDLFGNLIDLGETEARATTVLIILFFTRKYGYMACAWASFFSNLLMVLLSYFIGQKKYPVRYDLVSAGTYMFLVLVLYIIGMNLPVESLALKLVMRTLLLVLFLAFIIKRDLPLAELPYVGRFFKRK